MNPYTELFCKQNPKMTLECQNPECKKAFSISTEKVAETNNYKHTCPICGQITTFDFSRTFENFEKQCKALNIKVVK